MRYSLVRSLEAGLPGIPAGLSFSPREHVRKPRRWAERRYTRFVHVNQVTAGGHFASGKSPAWSPGKPGPLSAGSADLSVAITPQDSP